MGNIISKRKYTRLEAVAIDETPFESYTEVSSAIRNAKIDSVSDETFGKASNLITSSVAVVQTNTPVESIEEETDRDGWIVKRHETQARVTIELCNNSRIFGFDIDTTGFVNTCPTHAVIEGYIPSNDENNAMWTTLIQEETIRENSHNFFQLVDDDTAYSQVRLTVSPGGGIARFRTYGDIVPDWSDKTKEYNLASANHGARIVRWSDTENANKPNILMDNGTLSTHGWLTPRSRSQDRNDFIVIQLAAAGTLNSIVIDSIGFKGNSPLKVRVEGCNTQEDDPYQDVYTQWIPLVALSEIEQHALNTFAVVSEDILTHVRLTVYPDGGLQQIKCFGFIDQNKQLDYSENKMLANGNGNHSFISNADTFVAEEEEEEEEEDVISEKDDISSESSLETSKHETKQKTIPIEDTELFEETIIEELNGSTTQLLTPVVEKSHSHETPITVAEKEALDESELAAIEQLNSTTAQVSPPPTYRELDRDNISPVTIVSVEEIVLNEITTEVTSTRTSRNGKRKSSEPANVGDTPASSASKIPKRTRSATPKSVPLEDTVKDEPDLDARLATSAEPSTAKSKRGRGRPKKN